MNYENFARPESMLDYGPELGGIAELEAAELENMHFCEECGDQCDSTFCSAECEADGHTCDGDCDPGPEMEYDPGEYEPSEDDGDGYGDSGWQDDGRYDD